MEEAIVDPYEYMTFSMFLGWLLPGVRVHRGSSADADARRRSFCNSCENHAGLPNEGHV